MTMVVVKTKRKPPVLLDVDSHIVRVFIAAITDDFQKNHLPATTTREIRATLQ